MRVGILGCGAIGSAIAAAIKKGKINAQLVAVYDENPAAAKMLARKNKTRIAKNIAELARTVDVVVEAASQKAVAQYGTTILRRADLMVMSVVALLNERLRKRLEMTARRNGSRIYLPSGAVCGLDGVKAAAMGRISEATLTSTKPPAGFDIKTSRRRILYEGPATRAVRLFPKNINVAAALALAGIGATRTRVRIIADPKATRNTHEIRVKGGFGELVAITKNNPFPQNPRTSYIAALSAIRTLKNLTEVMMLGT